MTPLASPSTYELSHLQALEAEAVHIFREVAATFERPVLLFSGGKDSVVMLHVAAKAFWPAPLPFPVMHVDTGHNFDEVIEFRDRTVERLGLRLVVASVEDDIAAGRVSTRPGRGPAATACRRTHCCAASGRKQVRCRVRRRPPRRGEGPSQGACLQLPRRVRAVGSQGAAARTVEPLQRAAPAR